MCTYKHNKLWHNNNNKLNLTNINVNYNKKVLKNVINLNIYTQIYTHAHLYTCIHMYIQICIFDHFNVNILLFNWYIQYIQYSIYSIYSIYIYIYIYI